MKKLIVFLALILVHSNTFANPRAVFTLKGKAISTFEGYEGCGGGFPNYGVKEFEIIDFSDSNYVEPTALVLFPCPGPWMNERYKIGSVYEFLVIPTKMSVPFTDLSYETHKNRKTYRHIYPSDTITNRNKNSLLSEGDSLPGMEYIIQTYPW